MLGFRRYYVMLGNDGKVEHRLTVNTCNIEQCIKTYKQTYNFVRVVAMGD